MFPIIRLEHLVLRELTEQDAAAVLQCFSYEKVLAALWAGAVKEHRADKRDYPTLSE